MMWYPLEIKNKSERRGVKLKVTFSVKHNVRNIITSSFVTKQTWDWKNIVSLVDGQVLQKLTSLKSVQNVVF